MRWPTPTSLTFSSPPLSPNFISWVTSPCPSLASGAKVTFLKLHFTPSRCQTCNRPLLWAST